MAQDVVTPPKADAVLKTLDPAHPRLMLKDADVARLKALIEKDPLLRKCTDAMVARADRICTKPPVERTLRGPRLLHVSRECVTRVYTLGLAWRLTGRQKYADAVKKNLLAACAFKDWNPNHFLDTAEMTHAVGVGYDWFYHALDDATRERVKAGLIRNGLEPGAAAYDPKKRPGNAWWTRAVHNWNQVCNGGLIIGALAIAETDPEWAQAIVPEAVRLLPKAMVNYGPDGAWMEGPGYWKYATDYTVFALCALDTALGTDFGLSRIDGFSECGWFPIQVTGPTELPFNFADAGRSPRPTRNIPSLFWLARKFRTSAFAAQERAMVERFPGDPWDVLWYVPPGRKPPKPSLDKHFRGPVEVAIFRSAWEDPDALYLAVKAGFNQVNHAHCDVGAFVMDALGVRWAVDLGCDDYNLPDYWGRSQDATRWTYYRLSAHSHNVPLVNDRNQDVRAVTKFSEFTSTPKRTSAVVDLTSAYQRLAKRVKRGVAILDRRRVLVQDEFAVDKPVEIAWGMTTAAKITLDGSRATLTQDGKELRAEILSPEGASFTKESAEQKPPQATNKGMRRLMIRLPDQKGRVTIAVMLSPVWPRQKAVMPPELTPLSKW